jgi:hypothetical protein
MDEREVGTLFRAAPGDPPLPTFDLADVTAASARSRARRRLALLMAVACVVLALAGFGVSRIQLTGTTSGTSQVAGRRQPDEASGRLPNAFSPSPLQGSGVSGEIANSSGCDTVDRELATALAGELPAIGVGGPEPGQVCPAGSRSAAFRVVDGDRSGVVSVALAPPGIAVPLDSSGATARETTSSGGSIAVSSTPDPGSAPPLPADLDHIALALAARF